MTDSMDRLDDLKQNTDSQGNQQRKNKKTLDTFFPSKWLVSSMVGIVIIFNVIVGMKVFSLQKEKAVIEVLKARYESYAKIIRDVEDKEEKLRILTQKIIPLEKRAENAQKEVTVSNETLKKHEDAFYKIKAAESEIAEKLNAAQNAIAELSDEKQTLRQEKIKLEKIVAELKIKENRIEQKIVEKQKDLRVTEENILAAEVRLNNQQKHIKNVAAANSDFDDIRKQLSEFIKKINETEVIANERIEDLKKVVVGIANEKDQLSIQTINLTNEIKTIAQSNASIEEETSGFKTQNKEYKSEIDNVTSLSGQMMAANHELAKSSKQLTTLVAGMDSQKEKFDIYVQEIADLPDLKVQAVTFKRLLSEVEGISKTLSEQISNIQNNFDGRLEGMNLSFSTLQKEFAEFSLKIDVVEQALEKIASRVQEELKKNKSSSTTPR